LALLNPRHIRRGLPALSRALLSATLLCLTLVAYPLFLQFFGKQRVFGAIQISRVHVVDLLSFSSPPHIRHLHGTGRTRSRFTTPAARERWMATSDCRFLASCCSRCGGTGAFPLSALRGYLPQPSLSCRLECGPTLKAVHCHCRFPGLSSRTCRSSR